MTPANIVLGALVCAGAALLPDVDHPHGTIAHSAPGAGIVAGAVGTVAGGHRHATHSLLATIALLLVARFVPLTVTTATPIGQVPLVQGIITAALLSFAIKSLVRRISWPSSWVAGTILAAVITLADPDLRQDFVLIVVVGFICHLVGDTLTEEGVPWLWPLNPKPPAALQAIPILNWMWLRNGYFAIPILGKTKSKRERALGLVLEVYVVWVLALVLMPTLKTQLVVPGWLT